MRALKTWPAQGSAARSRGLADLRWTQRRIYSTWSPHRQAGVSRRTRRLLSDLDDAEAEIAERLDGAQYRDDILRLLFICCHPDLPKYTQQIALALRIVSGLSVKQIPRAFLVSEAAMEQRITRAELHQRRRRLAFRGARPAIERAERLAAVAAMLYLVFNVGLFLRAGRTGEAIARRFCEEAIRLAWLLLRLFPSEPEIMGSLTALFLFAAPARQPARFDAVRAPIVLLEAQDRSLGTRGSDRKGPGAGGQGDAPQAPRNPTSIQAAIAALHDRAARPQDADWAQIEALYMALERLQPSPVVTLNRAVAVSKTGRCGRCALR